jgi:hypothetical protein
MSVAGGILTDVLSKLSTLLGATYRELPNLFSLEQASSRQLENGYSAILLDGDNNQHQLTSNHTITRQLVIKVSYRTYTRQDSSRTKTVLATLYTNEEAIINKITTYPSPPSGFVQVVDPVSTSIETMVGDEDSYLINTMKFNVVYRFAIT